MTDICRIFGKAITFECCIIPPPPSSGPSVLLDRPFPDQRARVGE